MDLKTFIVRIKNAALLTDDAKFFFVAGAEAYPAELREKLIQKLNTHEGKFLEQGEKLIAQFEKERQEQSKRYLKEMRLNHVKQEKREESNADEWLDTNLSKI